MRIRLPAYDESRVKVLRYQPTPPAMNPEGPEALWLNPSAGLQSWGTVRLVQEASLKAGCSRARDVAEVEPPPVVEAPAALRRRTPEPARTCPRCPGRRPSPSFRPYHRLRRAPSRRRRHWPHHPRSRRPCRSRHRRQTHRPHRRCPFRRYHRQPRCRPCRSSHRWRCRWWLSPRIRLLPTMTLRLRCFHPTRKSGPLPHGSRFPPSPRWRLQSRAFHPRPHHHPCRMHPASRSHRRPRRATRS